MEKINKIKELLKASSKKIWLYLLSVLVIIGMYNLFLFVLEFYPELSGIPYGMTKAMLGVVTLKLVDELMLYEVDTMQNLKKNATAYAIYVVAYALVIALSISGA